MSVLEKKTALKQPRTSRRGRQTQVLRCFSAVFSNMLERSLFPATGFSSSHLSLSPQVRPACRDGVSVLRRSRSCLKNGGFWPEFYILSVSVRTSYYGALKESQLIFWRSTNVLTLLTHVSNSRTNNISPIEKRHLPLLPIGPG